VDSLHSGTTFPALGLAALGRYPDAIAFVHEGHEIRYREALARVSQWARELVARGLGPGDGVVNLCGNVPEAIYVSLAATAIGCRTSALHPLTSAEDMAFIVDDAEAKALVFDGSRFDERVTDVARQLPRQVEFLAIGPSEVAEDVRAASETRSTATITPVPLESDIASLMYSSGTTGQPKGVIQPHRSSVTMTMTCMPGWQLPTDDFRFLAATPLSHASVAFVLPAWINGGTVVLQPSFDPERFCAAIARERITTVFVVPTMLYVLLDQGLLDRYDLSSLQAVVYGAAPMVPSRLEEALERLGQVFVQLYGQAEAPAAVTALRKREHDPGRPHLMASCGQALPGIEVELHDDDDNVTAGGEVGEICVRGRLVADGYWKRPELTAETFRQGWLHTGDMARRDDEGYYYIVDRKKDMVITGGFNVFPREVEDVLATHSSVAMAAVIGVPDDRWGEAVTAFVVARPGAQIVADDLIQLVRDRKGGVYAPKSLHVVDTIPLTGLGKPDKKALRARYWSGEDRQVH